MHQSATAPRPPKLAERALRLSGGNDSAVLDTLAAAYAEVGRFPETVQTAERALALATSQSNTSLARKIAARLKLYRSAAPFRDMRVEPLGSGSLVKIPFARRFSLSIQSDMLRRRFLLPTRPDRGSRTSRFIDFSLALFLLSA